LWSVCLCVCMSVYPRAYLWNEPLDRSSQILLCICAVAVARSSSGGVAIPGRSLVSMNALFRFRFCVCDFFVTVTSLFVQGLCTFCWLLRVWMSMPVQTAVSKMIYYVLTGTLTLSPPIPLRLYTLPYWCNPLFLIFDMQALWRSVLSARAPACQKSKIVG